MASLGFSGVRNANIDSVRILRFQIGSEWFGGDGTCSNSVLMIKSCAMETCPIHGCELEPAPSVWDSRLSCPECDMEKLRTLQNAVKQNVLKAIWMLIGKSKSDQLLD